MKWILFCILLLTGCTSVEVKVYVEKEWDLNSIDEKPLKSKIEMSLLKVNSKT